MCSSKCKLRKSSSMKGRAVLEPNCNRAPLLERCNSSLPLIHNNNSSSTTTATHHQSPAAAASPRIRMRLINHQQQPIPAAATPSPSSANKYYSSASSSFKYTSSAIVEAPGSIAAARREQVAILQEQRKLRIAHYGRTTTTTTTTNIKSSSSKLHLPLMPDIYNHHDNDHLQSSSQDQKRCSFITPNSDPIYVAYHDQEWGVPVHDDKMLFELLVLTGAQVGSDWSSVLRKRQEFRDAFSGFDVEIVSKFSEKKMNGISAEYCMELSLVRGVVDNSKRILEIKKEFGSFDKYLWGFVNEKPIVTQYKWCHKIPAKTSKSETISKGMVRRGFRQVGPTVIHSFMQAAGLTNDHLITCPRH